MKMMMLLILLVMIGSLIFGEELIDQLLLLPLCHDGHDAFIGQYYNLRDTTESICRQMACKFNCSIGASAEFVNKKCSIMDLDKSMSLLHENHRQVLLIGDSYAGQLSVETRLWCHEHINQADYCNINFINYNAPHLTRFLPPFTANDTLTKALILHPSVTDIVVTTGNHWGPLKGFINTTEAALLYQEMLMEFAGAINTWNPDVHVIWYDIPPPHHSLVDCGPNQELYNRLAKHTLESLIKNIIFLNTSEFILERIRLQPHATTTNRHYCQGHKGSVPEAIMTRILSLLAAWL